MDFYTWGGGRKSLINNVVYKLVIPTLLFSLLFYFPKIILRGTGFNLIIFMSETIGGGSIWFTPALAVAELLVVFILALRPKQIIHYLVYGGFLWLGAELIRQSGFGFSANNAVPWYYKSGMEAVILLLMGGIYWKYEDRFVKIFSNRVLLIVISITYVCLCVCFSRHFRTALDWQGLNLYGLCIALLGSVVIIEWAKLLPTISFLNYAGRHSIGLYFFCGSIVNVFAVISKHICSCDHWWIVLVIALVSYLFSYFCIVLINKWIPFVYDLRKLINR